MEVPLEPANRQIITNKFLALRGILQLNQTMYANLFGMSKQALCKLEATAGHSQMTFASILMIYYTLKEILNSPYFRNFNNEQKAKTQDLYEIVHSFVSATTPDLDQILQKIQKQRM